MTAGQCIDSGELIPQMCHKKALPSGEKHNPITSSQRECDLEDSGRRLGINNSQVPILALLRACDLGQVSYLLLPHL